MPCRGQGAARLTERPSKLFPALISTSTNPLSINRLDRAAKEPTQIVPIADLLIGGDQITPLGSEQEGSVESPLIRRPPARTPPSGQRATSLRSLNQTGAPDLGKYCVVVWLSTPPHHTGVWFGVLPFFGQRLHLLPYFLEQ